jgi:hypothetical protein
MCETARDPSSDDAALAAALAAELNAPPATHALEADAALAAALEAEQESQSVSLSAEEQESASLALALSLQEEPSQPAARRAPAVARRDAESEQLRQHLFASAPAPSDAWPAAASAWPPASAPPPIHGRGGPSFAMVVGEEHGGAPSAAGAVAVARAPARSAAEAPRARPPRGPVLIIDGANVAFKYGETRAPSGFCADGIRRCVEYFVGRASLVRSDIVVVLNENRDDGSLDGLEGLRDLFCLTPTGKDDDVFLLQCASDHGAWVVTNDRWDDHRAVRHATEDVRRRRIRYAFCAGAFTPAADDLAKFVDTRGMHAGGGRAR